MKKALKRSLSILLAITIIFSSAYVGLGEVDFSRVDLGSLVAVKAKAASSGTTGDCTWTLDGTVLTISGNGAMGNYYYYSTLPWGKSITEVVIDNGVTGIGNYAFRNCDSLASVTIPDSVTSIGNDAFYYCTSLTSITIPDSVTGIGEYAFRGCTSLASVTIGSSVTSIGNYAFYYCTSLTSITIPDSVTSIGGSAFCDCTSLTSITIPDSVTSIGDYAFCDCDSLTSVTIGNGVTNIGYRAFYNCDSLTSVTIGNGVTSIGSYAFDSCSSLISVTIPDSVTSIGMYAFYNCTSLINVYITDLAAWCGIDFYDCYSNPLYYAKNLYINGELATDIVIPDGVTTIPRYAFSCENIVSVTIPDSVTSIGESAFRNCTRLTSITIPDSVTSIGYGAFYCCTNLNSIIIGNSVTSIGNYAFEGCTSLESVYITDLAAWCGIDFYRYDSNPLYYAKNLYINGELATDIVIPDSVTTIPEYAFSCENIVSVTIPDSVTSIGLSAFYGCDSLTNVYITDLAAWCGIDFAGSSSNPLCHAKKLYINGELATDIVIPDGVTSIGYAFYNCSSLTSVTIPDSVTSIGEYAFAYCSSLTSVTIPDSVTSIGGSAFYSCSSLTSVTIGNGVTGIGNCAFSLCTSLTSITIPDSVTSIGEDAFYKCTSLTNVYITDLVAWCGIDFYDSSSNPLCYAKNLYINGELATDIVVPDGVTSIGNYAFLGCSSLTSVTIPDSVTNIGNYAFEYCDSLTSVTIPDSVTSIGDYAFGYCTSLTSITIPDSVTSIGGYAFSGCASLTAINVFADNTAYSSADGVLFNNNKTTLIQYPDGKTDEAYKIPDSVKNFASSAFHGANFKSIVLGKGYTNVISSLFIICLSLENVVIPTNITSISSKAFSSYRNIKNVFYGGTQDEWASMVIASGNTYLTSARIHYNVDVDDWENHCTKPVVTKEPTCTSNGTQTYTCPCGYDVTETIYSLGHTYSDDWIVDKASTVNAAGSKHKECTVCGIKLETAVIPQLKPATPKLSSVANTPTGVKFVWSKVTGADSYVVYRKAYNASTKTWSGWQNIAKSITTNSYVDKTAKSGTYYIYTVKAANEAGYSGYNATGLKTYCLATPTLASVTNSATGVTVKWGKVTGATNYVVYRRAYNTTTKKWSGWTNLGKTTATSFADKTAKSGNYYIYTVKALAGTYTSAYNTTGLKTYFLSAPSLTKVTSTTSGVKFTWGKVTGASGYIVYRRTYNATTKTWGGWTKLGTITGNTNVTYVDASAQKGTYYIYTTKAYYGSYTSYYNSTGLKVKDIY